MVDFAKKLAEAKSKKAKPADPMQQRIQDVVKGKKADPKLQKKEEEGLAIVQELNPIIAPGVIITSQEMYKQYDVYLSRVRAARKDWENDLYGPEGTLTKQKEAIAAQLAAIESLHALNRKVDRPREVLEKGIKAKMEDYQRKIAAQAAEEERQKQIEAQKLRDEAEKLKEKANTLPTVQLRAKLEARRIELEEQAQAVEAIEVTTVQGDNSSTRKKFTWKVTDLKAFCGGIEAGQIPENVIDVVVRNMDAYFKETPEKVLNWPGVEAFDDIKIVGGKGDNWRKPE